MLIGLYQTVKQLLIQIYIIKKIMKKIYLIAVTLVLAFFGCQDDSYDAPNEFSDAGFYTSQGQKPLEINIFDYISFTNLSQGYKSHEWTIDEGNFFLKGPFKSRDSSEVYEKKIINPGETTSEDKTIHVYFKESGQQKVRLFNVFDEYVEFRGFRDGSPYTLAAQEVEGNWVIDTTFSVKVYDTIIPEIQIKQNDIVIEHKSSDTIYVEAGDFLEFTDLTTIGEPTDRWWFIRNALEEGVEQQPEDVIASSSDEVAQILFKKLGNFEAGVNVSRQGQNIPGDFDRYLVPRPIKVIPSSKPFEITGDIVEREDETISIPFNGEFAPFINKESFFEVDVNGVNFSVESVTINEDDETFLDIKLDDPIYRPDVITVTLLPGSDIESTDTRSPVIFTDEPVIMHDVNLLGDIIGGFEDFGAPWQPFAPAWGANQGGLEWTDERAYLGDYSMKMSMANGERCAAEVYLDDPIIFEAGVTYEVKYWMYVESADVLPTEIGLWFLNEWRQFWNSPNKPLGQWLEQSFEVTNAQPLAQIYFRILGPGQNYVAYFDNFYIVKKEVRP